MSNQAQACPGPVPPRDILLPPDRQILKDLRAGDAVTLTGVLYTARDAAHKRLISLIDRDEALPFPVDGQVIYYVGPTPAPPGRPIGAAGPTTSSRMNRYIPALAERGLASIVGKGLLSPEAADSLVRRGAVYFAAVGGAAALLAQTVTDTQLIAFDDLGTEAVRRLTVVRFPAIVVLDSLGNDLYRLGPAAFRGEIK